MDDLMASQGLCLGLLMLSAHLFGRLALKLHLGQMIGQLLGGVIVGPYCLESLGLLRALHLEGYGVAFESFHFLIFTFLGVIAFALGEELHIDRLRAIGKNAAIISMIQACITWVFLTAFFLFTGMHWPLALVIGSIGVATAPAITFVLLNTFEIEGRFRNMVANILVLDDVFEVILFSIFVQAAAKIYKGGEVHILEIGRHLVGEFGAALGLGLAVFLFLRVTVRTKALPDFPHDHAATLGPNFVTRLLTAHPTPSVEVLVLVIGSVAVASGLGLGLHLPFLIIGVTAGILVANLHSHALFESLKIDNIMPLLNLVFFALIGANIHFDVFHYDNLFLIAGYVAARGVGKLFGTWFGCRLTGQDAKVTAALPYLMLPQAGVAAVEAVYVVTLLGDAGRMVADVVLPSLVIFEISGVFLSERTLLKWRRVTLGEAEVVPAHEKVLRETFADDLDLLAGLAAYVPKGLAGIPVKAKDLRGAIGELAAAMEKAHCVTDRETVVDRAWEREKTGSTAIGCGVCVPHGKILGQNSTVCAIGYLSEPIEGLDPPDGIPIDTVILLIAPIERPEEHLRALSTVARVFSEEEFRTNFHAAMRHGNADALLRASEHV